MKNKKKKVCLISSSGGHFEQLLMLKKLELKYNVFVVTEKTKYNRENKNVNYFVLQINRKEVLFLFKILLIAIKSLYIFIKEKPDVVISTGVLASIPMLFIAHVFKKKVIYIESFAKINTPTMTGDLIYKKNIADLFLVQWEPMLKVYPNAVYKGGIY